MILLSTSTLLTLGKVALPVHDSLPQVTESCLYICSMVANKLVLRLDWSEMDLFGHINNVSYFKYIQASRVNLWENTGMQTYFTDHHLGPALAKTECRFLKPLFYPGTIRIECFVKQIHTTSFQLHHFIYNDSGELCAEGEDVIVFFDYKLHKKTALTDELKAQLTPYLLQP